MRAAALAGAVLVTFVLAGAAGAATSDVLVRVDRTAITTSLGRDFVLHSTIANHGSAELRGLIAHLNVLSFRTGVYIDPEDWSSHRTRYLVPIAAGRSVTLTWKLKAVNAGSIGVYVAVLPRSSGPVTPVVGQAVHVSIAERKTLNARGVLPLALGVPATLAALALVVRVRRRRYAVSATLR